MRRQLGLAAVAAATGPVADRVVAEVAGLPQALRMLADVARDGRLLRHSADVCVLGVLLGAQHLDDVTPDLLGHLATGLLLHDVGKLALPPGLLARRGPLSEAEVELVRRHPVLGEAALPDGVSLEARTVVRSHHERWDGRGYPDGLAGEAIPTFARIAAVADVYDAMTAKRAYRGAAPPRAGWEAVVAGAGTAFDPAVAATFRSLVLPLDDAAV